MSSEQEQGQFMPREAGQTHLIEDKTINVAEQEKQAGFCSAVCVDKRCLQEEIAKPDMKTSDFFATCNLPKRFEHPRENLLRSLCCYARIRRTNNYADSERKMLPRFFIITVYPQNIWQRTISESISTVIVFFGPLGNAK